MARTPDPLPQRDDPVIKLARFLRTSQSDASTITESMTLKKISQMSGVSEGSLSKAHNGDPRVSWRTVEGWVRACNGDLMTARRLWNKVSELQEEKTPTDATALQTRAFGYWERTRGRAVVPGLETETQFLLALTALRKYTGMSLRELSQATERIGVPYSRATLGAILAGERAMTFDHLAAVLAGCGVPVRQQQGWARTFAGLDPARDVRIGWMPRSLRRSRLVEPAREQAEDVVSSPARTRFAFVLERALTEEGVTIKEFAARARLDIPLVDRLFAGKFLPAHMLSRASEAAVGASPRTRRELTMLAQTLVRSPTPEERREWGRFCHESGIAEPWAG
ncbi:helix-turn-helix domain-containing protein [Streptomyces phaeochromogenes]|uniref:helix-turn-helix domain-containing protein n=1 Tax=Streptomyces phaeochromogenes TaxID=1923 RepID=UPI0006E3B907|nr:helix-turn-helix transcriptional regulator [Streptomyces phaeochromogenes]